MTATEMERRKAICEAANVDDIDDVSDGFHTFRQLYYQRMILFATIVKQNKDKAWKSLRHEDGELCFGGGWFIVGVDTPEGSFTYHYEDNFFSLFDCEELECGKHWDGHTEKDVTRLLSLPSAQPEPCKDAVSREDVINFLCDWICAPGERCVSTCKCLKGIRELPPIKLKDALDDAYAHGYTAAEAKFYRWREEHECEDAVSRTAVMDILYLDPGITVEQEKMIKQLPSVMPKPKIGKWNFIGDQMFECSCCRKPYTQQQLENLKVYKDDPELPNYCPNCGSYNGSDKNSDK